MVTVPPSVSLDFFLRHLNPLIRVSNAASCLANRRPPNVGKFMLKMTEITEKIRWRTGGHANLDKKTSSCEGDWLDFGRNWIWSISGWYTFPETNDGIPSWFKDKNLSLVNCWCWWWLMMLESSVIFNMMNAKIGGAPLHILMTLKITHSKLFTNPLAVNNHLLEVKLVAHIFEYSARTRCW